MTTGSNLFKQFSQSTGYCPFVKRWAITVALMTVTAAVSVVLTQSRHDPAVPAAALGTTISPTTTTSEKPTTTTSSTTSSTSSTTTTSSTTSTTLPVVFLTHPIEIGARADEVAKAIIGRALNDAEEAEFVAVYHSFEKQGGAPSVGAAAQRWIKERFPGEASAHDYLDRLDQYSDLLKKSGELADSTGQN